MLAKCLRLILIGFLTTALFAVPRAGFAQDPSGAEKARGIFDKEQGTILNKVARVLFHEGAPVNAKAGQSLPEYSNVDHDWLIVTALAFVLIAVLFVSAAKASKVRPEGKPTSLANSVEWAVESFRDYLVSVMGESLAYKYTPLVSSFFFTILICNWLGLIPGLLAPTSIPMVPISFAIAAFFCVHFIAIREAGVKSWFMHFVGEPIWLAPLNFPLHIIGELIKPLSLSLRLLCNVFGEEQVVVQLTGLAIVIMAAIKVPLPLQLPMLLLGTFFGFLQALVFSTLLAIYIAILATHHEDHDAHNAHGHVEHDDVKGHHLVVAHSNQLTVG